MYMYIYVYVYIYIYVYVCAYTYAYVYMCLTAHIKCLSVSLFRNTYFYAACELGTSTHCKNC